MKKTSLIFSTLFLTLPIMPLNAFADDVADIINARMEAAAKAAQEIGISSEVITANAPVSAPSTRSASTEPITLKANAPVPAPSTRSASTGMITVSGTVRDDTDVIPGANIIPIDSNGTRIPNVGTSTDMNGHFKLEIPANTQLQVSYMGYGTKTVKNPGQNLDITLATSDNIMTEIPVIENHHDGDVCSGQALTDPYAVKAEKGKYKKIGETWVCVPNACVQDYEVVSTVCVHKQCTEKQRKDIFALEAEYKNGSCIATSCIQDYELKNNTCVHKQCSSDDINKLNAKEYEFKGGKCIAKKCISKDYTLDKDSGTCIKNECEQKDLDKLNATAGSFQGGKCVPNACKDDFFLDNNKCVKQECSDEQLKTLNAKAGKIQNGTCIPTKCDEKIYTLRNGSCDRIDKRNEDDKQKALEEKKKKYEDAKATEQSTANKTLTALTTAATGIGGMELMQGLAEQSADKDAAADMAAYIQTMRCTYADGKQVKAGPDEIELPGGNNQELMKYRTEYIALAADLKERKNALGMKPGIESEEILDKASSGLYDDESIGITSGNYASLYRAQALGSDADQAKLDDAAKTSKNRVIAGGVLAGAGVIGGVVGNSLINGKLGEAIKSKKAGKETQALLKEEEKALNNLKSCLKSAGAQGTDKLVFENFYPSVLSVKDVDCKKLLVKDENGQWVKPTNLKAVDMFADSTDEEEISEKLLQYFDLDTIAKMTGFSISNSDTAEKIRTNLENHIKQSVKSVQARFKEAEKKDKESAEKSGIDLSSITGSLGGDGEGLSSLASLFGGDTLSSITGKLGSTTEQVEQ